MAESNIYSSEPEPPEAGGSNPFSLKITTETPEASVGKEKISPYTTQEAQQESAEKVGEEKDLTEKETPVPRAKEEVVEVEDYSEIERFFIEQKIPYGVSTKVRQFGYDIFEKKVSTFAPVTNVPVGSDYVIGPGDSFTVSLWGKTEARYPVTVDRDGKILLPEVGMVNVWGLTLSELKKVLKAEIKQYNPEFQLSVTMQGLRTITVFVIGNVKVPGSYTVSSLSTTINALFACGGPTKNGTLRKILLRRKDKVIKTLDLYDFLLKGDKSQDMRLQSGDTIFVPLIGRVMGISGNVKRPAIFEMKDTVTLDDALVLAGGITPVGYLQRVQVERIVAHEMSVVVDLDLSIKSYNDMAKFKIDMQDRDLIKIFPIIPKPQNVVHLQGHVVRGGNYELKEDMKISDLIGSFDDLRSEPHLEYAEIIRLEEPNLHERVIPFNLKGVLDKNPEDNLRLQKFDRINVYSKWDFEDKYLVTIEGEVRKPGKYAYMEDMRVSTLVFEAGNLTKRAYMSKAEVLRVTSDREIKAIPFDLAKAMGGDSREDFLLQNEDKVVIHNIWETKSEEMVSVIGQINNPGDFRLTQGMRINDLIFRAGGFKKEAYLKKAELTRVSIEDGEEIATQHMNINIEKVLVGDKTNDILLKNYDTLKIHIIPEWNIKKSASIEGEVRFPGIYKIKKGEKLSSLIKRAGGYASRFYLRGAVFTRK